MSYKEPVLLAGQHTVTGFDCGRPALNDWLLRRALGNQASGTSRTWVVTVADTHTVAAFYASATASVLRSETPTRFSRNQPEELPAVLLARMAVDTRRQGQGLGAALLRHFMLKAAEVAASVGVRLVLVHAKDEPAKAFYRHYGFVESPVDPLTLLMLLPSSPG
ncbi:MAG: GNAT family N-acetyltransferase [Acidimicrobiales bacterium]